MQFFNPFHIIAVLIAISVHECAHGLMARFLGDPTAERDGRLTLNPLAHLDPLGALLFLVVGFGWAKPVPVNPAYFRHPARDTALTALAGPASNLLLAFLSFLLMVAVSSRVPGSATELLYGTSSDWLLGSLLARLAMSSLFVNLGLMAFNLLPIAPLDGSKIVQIVIPYRYQSQYEDFLRNGPWILLVLLLTESLLPIHVISVWVYWIITTFLHGFALVVPF